MIQAKQNKSDEVKEDLLEEHARVVASMGGISAGASQNCKSSICFFFMLKNTSEFYLEKTTILLSRLRLFN